MEGGIRGGGGGVILQEVNALTGLRHGFGHADNVAFALGTDHGAEYGAVGRPCPHGAGIFKSRGLAEIYVITLLENQGEGVPDVVIHHLPVAQGCAGGRGSIDIAVVVDMAGKHVLLFQRAEIVVCLRFRVVADDVHLIVGIAYGTCHILAIGTDGGTHFNLEELRWGIVAVHPDSD